jgi:hypothetical protein
MSNKIFKNACVAAIVVALITPAFSASASTPTTKKISITQGKKIYDQALKSTKLWLSKNSYTITVKTIDTDKKDNPKKNTVVAMASVDKDKNIFIINSEETAYLINETLYFNNLEGDLADYEIEIVNDLGLNLNAKYAVTNPLKLDPGYTIEDLRQELSGVSNPSFTLLRDGAKTTALSLSKSGSAEILTITLNFPATYWSAAAKKVLTTKIERGVITASTENYTSKDQNYKKTTTYKSFTGKVSAPEGPYLDWDQVVLDPRYVNKIEMKLASLLLESLVREGKALAAFEDSELTIENWKDVARNKTDILIFDKGVEFTFQTPTGGSKKACGVFTEDGAKVKLTTCTEQGFTTL